MGSHKYKKHDAGTETAMNYYRQAETHALKANELASDAREKLALYKENKATIDRWDEIMSNTHPWIWAIFFVIISVVEFLFSLDLYTDLLPFAPWIIPIGIIVISVFISHWLAVKLMPSLRNKEFTDKRVSTFYRDHTDRQIWDEVNKSSNRNFIAGIVGAVVVTSFIYWLSNERVSREITAGMRTAGFGVYDLLPVVFYVFEIIAGILILYLIRRVSLGLKVSRLKKQFDKIVRTVADETRNAIDGFEQAEAKGFDLLHNTISESIHIAFYRNKNCNPSDEENYIAEPQNVAAHANFQLVRTDKTKTLEATVHIFSEYNYAATVTSDEKGLLHIPFTSFEHDVIKKVVVEFSDGTDCEDQVIYQTDNDTPHRILFRE
jgi:hypothetical protein